jgi:hypothetical protein
MGDKPDYHFGLGQLFFTDQRAIDFSRLDFNLSRRWKPRRGYDQPEEQGDGNG